ncbi:adenine nucleotide alpha hydrolases-like protein [Choiromyces venosus 120613-1]|uniref:Diphthine--ammonia ligase n=1 Tax=Choiromyces venosus 120613-1 TaxID=1336337 RepID=A0A3N4J2L4_9PEZI|nr:adenine nucleotide alpha hydrolases-like protein [Choiromyces venosus 120613-1]
MEVIALISGGKDSFFSLLHTIANGHKVVALANLHPPTITTSDPITTHLPSTTPSALLPSTPGTKDELDSFMYQTVGHTVLPLYPHALNIPLYRKAITGTSVDQNLSYAHSSKRGDETEDLVPLLEYIIAQHPGVKAICTGAILSTYQRTRVESVCERLGLISLSYLWQREQAEILADMEVVGLDARIVKVAAVGLDPEGWLWENVTEARRRRMLDGLERKWGVHVAGEGGEYETVVVKGPGWRGIIEVPEDGREVVRSGGGVGHLKITKADFVPKEGVVEEVPQKDWVKDLRIPNIWDADFERILKTIISTLPTTPLPPHATPFSLPPDRVNPPPKPSISTFSQILFINNITSPPPSPSTPHQSITTEISSLLQTLSALLATHGASFRHITTCTLLLRHMSHFPLINTTYSTYFTTPLPPSRICISVGDLLPTGVNVMLGITADLSSPSPRLRRGLHVQSRSYWAPANIGPYSQSITSSGGWTSLAGMIPLVPASMELLNNAETREEVVGQAVLGLQHMWRVARAAEVAGILGCVVFVTRCEAVGPVVEAWKRAWERWKGEVGWKGLWSSSPQSSSSILERYGEEGEEEQEGKEEEEVGFTPPLIIAQTSSLPRSSTSEWAGTAIDGPWLHKLQNAYNSTRSPPSSSSPRLHVTPQSTTYGPNAPHSPAGGLQMFCLPPSSPSALAIEIKRRISAQQMEAGNATVYVPAGVASIGEFDTAWVECVGDGISMQVVPVERVWDGEGKEMSVGIAVRLGGKEDF